MFFRNFLAPFMVMSVIPFATTGGVWTLYWLDYNLSVAAGVGFIALAGTSAEIGVLMISFIDQKVARLGAEEEKSSQAIWRAVRAGTTERVRPVAMTSIATIVGLLPIMWSNGTGAEVMHRIAAPTMGGMVTVLIVTLLVLPVAYGLALHIRARLFE